MIKLTPPGRITPEVFFVPKRKEWTNDRPCEVVDPSNTDPQGSWTGVPREPYEKPVQDADDM